MRMLSGRYYGATRVRHYPPREPCRRFASPAILNESPAAVQFFPAGDQRAKWAKPSREAVVTADEATWRSCFAATRDQAASEWSDFAVEILTVLAMAGSASETETEDATRDALLWFLRHRADVLHEATRWAGMDIVSFRSTPGGLERYSNERALETLREIRAQLGG